MSLTSTIKQDEDFKAFLLSSAAKKIGSDKVLDNLVAEEELKL